MDKKTISTLFYTLLVTTLASGDISSYPSPDSEVYTKDTAILRYYRYYDPATGQLVHYIKPVEQNLNNAIPENIDIVIRPTINITGEIIFNNEQGPAFPPGFVPPFVPPEEQLPPGAFIPILPPGAWNPPGSPPSNPISPPDPDDQKGQKIPPSQTFPILPPVHKTTSPPFNPELPPDQIENEPTAPPFNPELPPDQIGNEPTPPQFNPIFPPNQIVDNPTPPQSNPIFPPNQIPPPQGSMKIVVNQKSPNTIALLNQTSNIAVVFDITANITLLINGNNGDIVIVDATTRTGVLVTGQKNNLLWVATNGISFESYINQLDSLKIVFNFAVQVGTKFSLDKPDTNVLKLVSDLIGSLGVKIGIHIKLDFSNALDVLVKFVQRLNTALKDANSVLLPQFNEPAIESDDVTLDHFVDIFESLPKVIGKIVGGIKVLIDLKIRLNLKLIFTVKSGIETVGHILDAVTGAGVNVLQKVKQFSLGVLFDMIASVSGPASVGYGAFVRAVGMLIGVVKGTVTVEDFIDALVKFSVTKLPENAFVLLTNQLQHLLNSLRKLGNGPGVPETIEDVQKLISGKLVIGGIDISKIIGNMIQVGTRPALDIVMNVLVSIHAVVNVDTSVPTFVLYVLSEVGSGLGFQAIHTLFPSLKIDDELKASGNIYPTIMKKFTLVDFMWSGFNLLSFIKKLPIIGDIYSATSNALNIASNDSYNLYELFKSALGRHILKRITLLLGILNNESQ